MCYYAFTDLLYMTSKTGFGLIVKVVDKMIFCKQVFAISNPENDVHAYFDTVSDYNTVQCFVILVLFTSFLTYLLTY